ncbi:MAG: hypothetical protein LBC42_01975, partial [Puniceicoccales bacterium]|nr:hypothetical protein [Puniceicoccales bacterium]
MVEARGNALYADGLPIQPLLKRPNMQISVAGPTAVSAETLFQTVKTQPRITTAGQAFFQQFPRNIVTTENGAAKTR